MSKPAFPVEGGVGLPVPARGPAFHVLYSSDNHGNNAQYRKVVAYALEHRDVVRAVVFGGDLSPKCQYKHSADYYGTMLAEQAEWITRDFASILAPLRDAGIPAFAIMGNGDVSANYKLHLANEAAGLYRMVDCRRLTLTEVDGITYDVVGLPYVPFTFSSMKDFEVHDGAVPVTTLPEGSMERYRAEYSSHQGDSYYGAESRVVPYHSRPQRVPATFRASTEEVHPTETDGWRGIEYAPARAATHSMTTFLSAVPFWPPPAGRVRTLFISHAPPQGTIADLCWGRDEHCALCEATGGKELDTARSRPHVHAGSPAVLDYLHKASPWISFHGHIHETTRVAGTCMQTLRHAATPAGEVKHAAPAAGGAAAAAGEGVTHVIASGNDPLYTRDGKLPDGMGRKRAEKPVGETVWAVLVDIVNPGREGATVQLTL